MTTKTKIELAAAVLRKMGIVDANSSPSSVDTAYVVSEYADLLAELVDDGYAYWPENAIPQAVFQHVVRLLVNETGPAFGVQSTLEDREARKQLLKKPIIKHCRRRHSGLPVRATYF